MNTETVSKSNLVVFTAFIAAISAVVFAPITGFWWNTLIFFGAYQLAKDATIFLIFFLLAVVVSKEKE